MCIMVLRVQLTVNKLRLTIYMLVVFPSKWYALQNIIVHTTQLCDCMYVHPCVRDGLYGHSGVYMYVQYCVHANTCI